VRRFPFEGPWKKFGEENAGGKIENNSKGLVRRTQRAGNKEKEKERRDFLNGTKGGEK